MPINKARFYFADPIMVRKYEELGKISPMGEWAKGMSGQPTTNLEYLQIMKSAVDVSSQASSERFQIEREINQNFADMILACELRCFAFESPRKIDSEPVEMHVQHWTAYPNWTEGTFRANGLELIELRVLRAEVIEDAVKPVSPKQPGRPSIRTLVEDAFGSLAADGHIDCNAPAVSHYPAIREWIGQNRTNAGIDARSLSNEGIRAHFSPLFKELRKTRKQ